MNIAVLSGKGGTGKTTLSVNLSFALDVSYVDADVEAPNGFLFLHPQIQEQKPVEVLFPVVDDEKCTNCGMCVKACEFNALAMVQKDLMLFQKLCHGCTACQIVCPQNAIHMEKRRMGMVEQGTSMGKTVYRGVVDIGEPMAVPVISHLLSNLPKEDHLIDCPPGTSCNVVKTLSHGEGAILVTEPTAFGFHDLQMAVELVEQFQMPMGVVINKDGGNSGFIETYLEDKKIPLLGKIPYSMELAKAYSKGNVLYLMEEYKEIFDVIAQRAREVFSWKSSY